LRFLSSCAGSFYGDLKAVWQVQLCLATQAPALLHVQLLLEQLEEQQKMEAHPDKFELLGKSGQHLLAAQI